MRAVAGRHRPERRPQLQRERPVLQFRLRRAAQSRRHGGQSGRPGAAARRHPGLRAAPHRRAREVPQGRSHRRPSIRIPRKARSATLANDQVQPIASRGRGRPGRRRRARAAYRSGAAHLDPGVLRDARDRRRHPGGRRATAAWPRPISRSRWAASPRPSRPIAPRRRPTSSSSKSESRGDDLLAGLDTLAEVCDAGTRVDRDRPAQRRRALSRARAPRRERLSDRADHDARRRPLDLRACSRAPDAKPVGRTIAVVGAKGGVGASTIAHNVAWAIARDLHARCGGRRPRPRLRHRRPRLQPGSAAGHRRRGVLARAHRHRASSTACCRNAPTI